MKTLLRFLGAALLLLLPACGFQPLYGTAAHQDSSATTSLGQIYIAGIPDRPGQMLRNSLIDRFYRGGYPADPLYTLTVQPLKERRTDLDITKSSDATRAQLRLGTDMALIDKVTGAVLLQRELVTVTSYNILQSQFTTRVAEENARQNAIEDLARQIETQLALYFSRDKKQ